MNNYTSFITEEDTRPTTQPPHGDKKMWLLAMEAVYWINMNVDIECMVRLLAKTTLRKGITL